MKAIKSGEIYLIDASRVSTGYAPASSYIDVMRVVFFNGFWVFADLRYEDEKWHMDKLQKGLSYFSPIGRWWFDESPLELGFSEVSAQLQTLFRTDLIIYISRIRDIGWNNDIFTDRQRFEAYLEATQSDVWLSQIIAAENIYISVYGKGDGIRPPVMINAENGKFFTAAEVLWQAAQIQRLVYLSASKGVGIFRMGSKRGVATYYAGEYLDRAGILAYYERSGINTNV
jgi:hypothetical protein